MDHPALGRKLHGAADACEEFEPLASAQAHLLAVVIYRLTANELHHEVRKPLEGRAAVYEIRDVGVLQAGGDLPLAPELPHDAIQIETAPHHFDRDLLLECLIHAHRAVDRTHAAAADTLDDLVRSQANT